MKERAYERLRSCIRKEEEDHILGLIEYYIESLDDTPGEKIAKHILRVAIMSIERERLKRE